KEPGEFYYKQVFSYMDKTKQAYNYMDEAEQMSTYMDEAKQIPIYMDEAKQMSFYMDKVEQVYTYIDEAEQASIYISEAKIGESSLLQSKEKLVYQDRTTSNLKKHLKIHKSRVPELTNESKVKQDGITIIEMLNNKAS
ncbi:22221_t:CDS:2, partial [Gigaspora margarita]